MTSLEDLRIYSRNSVDSTQDESRRLIEQNPEIVPFALLSEEQTCGRGKGERVWDSPVGNIYMTLALELPKTLALCTEKIQEFSLVGASVLQCLITKIRKSVNVFVKWPNDVLVDQKKCAGVLPEVFEIRDARYLLIGVGINWGVAPLPSSFALSGTISMPRLEFAFDFARDLYSAVAKILAEDAANYPNETKTGVEFIPNIHHV